MRASELMECGSKRKQAGINPSGSFPDFVSSTFNTISGADWVRELAAARRTPNAVSEQIRARIREFLTVNQYVNFEEKEM